MKRAILLSITGVLGATFATAVALALSYDTRWLTNAPGRDSAASVNRGWVAWQSGTPSSIWLWDRVSGEKRKISTVPGTNQNPNNYKDRVVWECGFDPDGEICYFDGKTTRRLTRDRVDDASPHIWGSAIVWVRDAQKLMLYDAGKRRLRMLADYTSAAIAPTSAFAVRDNRAKQEGTADQRVLVAFQGYDAHGQPAGLLVYDGATDSTTTITRGIDLQPTLAGQFVAFSRYMREDDNRSQEIFYFNRRTGRLTRVTRDNVQDNYPSVSGRYLVWTTNFGYADGALNVLDLQTGRRSRIVRNAAVWQVAAHAAGQIAWWSDSGGVHVFDAVSGTTQTLSEDGEAADSDGTTIAWEAYNAESGGQDIGVATAR